MAGVLSFGRGLFEKAPVNGVDTSYKTFFRLQAGQIVLSQLFGWEGAIAPVTPEFAGRFVSSQFPTFRPKPNLDPAFARWIIRNSKLWDQLRSAAKGMGDRRRTLSPEIFFGASSTLPPLAEQQRIVAHLDAIEACLARVQKLREDQEQQLLAALRSAFHRIESESEWIEMGKVAPLVRREVEIDPTASYTEYGIKSFFKGIFLRRKMKGEEYSWQQLFWLKKGDVVFSNIMAWEKAIGFASPEADGWIGNHRMLVCEPRQEQVVSEWLYFYFTTAKGFAEILKASPGTAARNKTLKASSLLTIPVPIPSLDKQFEFKRLMDLRLAIQRKAQSTSERISALLPSLLDSVFNG